MTKAARRCDPKASRAESQRANLGALKKGAKVVFARSEATKQSQLSLQPHESCIASLRWQ
jgi:hypothetical protein